MLAVLPGGRREYVDGRCTGHVGSSRWMEASLWNVWPSLPEKMRTLLLASRFLDNHNNLLLQLTTNRYVSWLLLLFFGAGCQTNPILSPTSAI